MLNPNTQYPYSSDRKSAISSSSTKNGISTLSGRSLISSPSVSHLIFTANALVLKSNDLGFVGLGFIFVVVLFVIVIQR